MARTRGAAKKAVEESSEEVPAADHNTADDDPTLTEKPAPKPRRTRSRRGKETAEEQVNGETVQDTFSASVVTRNTLSRWAKLTKAAGRSPRQGRVARRIQRVAADFPPSSPQSPGTRPPP